jgi:undecaprenyl-phosphate galactose phosphotransferase
MSSQADTAEDRVLSLAVQSLTVDGGTQTISVDGLEMLAVESSYETAALRPEFYLTYGKYMLDLLVVMLLAPLWMIVYLLIAFIVLVVDGRPVFYKSARIGRGGAEIGVLKFRTMRPDSESKLAGMLAADPQLMEEFRDNVKLRLDPRVTSLGRWLRRLSLDELPQMINVLKGEMSLVGPRPVLQSELDELYGEKAPIILEHRPGMTGLWQVSGRSLLSYDRRIELDVDYSTNCCLRTDLAILARTLPSVLKGDGAF